ncbi:tetratricopeptide repeat protein [Azospirillum isscasi]|uniref:Tetratricopeptide repeat protein n=1 Tax=Azospirillum isscasi TaxID=3053926 RepID=A0ABU0WCC0_9PROT|nr:tetratricopeptide repeat protein [Azospirillum isscasi]MDQ2101732.1 tetratricopeptide repeat protein [Azospirillum isscasi]
MASETAFPDPAGASRAPLLPRRADDLHEAARHYHAGRFGEAIGACRAILVTDPGHADALNLLGAALFSSGEGNAGGASVALNEAVRIAPGHIAALTNLAVLLQHRREWAGAGRVLRRLAACRPESLEACSRLGAVSAEAGDLDASLRFFRRTARLDPQTSLHWFNLGTVRSLGGDVAGAIGDLRRAIASAPDDAHAYIRLGEALLGLGRVAQAAGVFRRALRLDPAASGAADGLVRCRRYQAAAAFSGGSAASAEGGLAIRGAFVNSSGYGYACRRVIQTLRARGVPLQAIGIKGPDSWPGEDLDRPVPARAMVNFLIPLATERVPGLATVTFSMFEGTRIPPAWRRLSDLSDLIVVPCESSRIAWASQGYPEDRLRVCPLGVDPGESNGGGPLTLADPQGRPVSSYRHRFLNISDFIPRKNIDGLLRVWLRSTTRADDAVLVLKLGKGGNPALPAELTTLVRRSESAVGRRLADAAPVVLVDHALTDAGMTALVRTATHYWSMSHGEGWDLPMTRAGALGASLIAPRHSAYVDYLDDRIARLIPARVGPALLPYSDQPFPPFHGLDWWNPDEDAATAILAGIVRGDGVGEPSARDHLLQRFSWNLAADRLLAILDEAGLR